MTLLFRFLVGLIALGPALFALVTAVSPQGVQHFSRALDRSPSFNQTCTVGSYLFDNTTTTLGMYCNTDDSKDYAYDWTFIELDLCVANYYGVLVPYPEGNFSETCHDCNITWSHVYLTPSTTTYTSTPHTWITTTVTSVYTPRWDDLYLGCGGCADDRYHAPSATIDLHKFMTNENGTIGCHRFKGATRDARADPTMKAEVAKRTLVPRL